MPRLKQNASCGQCRIFICMLQIERMEVDLVGNRCNLRCVNCAMFCNLGVRTETYTLEEFRNDVKQLASVLRTDLFEFVGGEPLLLGDRIVDYIHAVKESGIGPLGLITNGTLLMHRKYETIIPLFDRILVSHYKRQGSYEALRKWAEEKKYPNVCLQERPQFIKIFDGENPRLSEEETLETFSKCGARLTCNTLFKGRLVRCGQAYKGFEMLKGRGIPFEDPGTIGIDLYTPKLEERIKAYRESTKPEKFCSYCRLNGSVAKWEPWREEK